MPINLNTLNIKLKAMTDKNLDDIVANKVDIPSMGKTYTKAQLRAWLQKRINLLEGVRAGNYTDTQIAKFIDNVYKTLSSKDKLVADKVIANGSSWNPDNIPDDNEKLVLIRLYKFVTKSKWLS